MDSSSWVQILTAPSADMLDKGLSLGRASMCPSAERAGEDLAFWGLWGEGRRWPGAAGIQSLVVVLAASVSNSETHSRPPGTWTPPLGIGAVRSPGNKGGKSAGAEQCRVWG